MNLNGWPIKFFLHPGGYDRLTSQSPCAPFLMKVVSDPETGAKGAKSAVKSVMAVSTESKQVQFHVARLAL